MKCLLILFLIFFAIQATAQNGSSAVKHVGAGAVIGGIGGYAAYKLFKGQRAWTWVGAVGSSFAAGFAKETFYDRPRGAPWESQDVLFTTLGGVLSGVALGLIFKNSQRRGRGGRNCGCLVVKSNDVEPIIMDYSENGSGNIGSEIEVFYLLK